MKRLQVALAATALGIPLTVCLPSTAEAAESCYGASCTDKDPARTICMADAYTIYERSAVIAGGSMGVLQMRYSPRCHANWVRYTPWGGTSTFTNILQGIDFYGNPWIWRPGTGEYPRGLIGSTSGASLQRSFWTSMVSADGKACMSVDVSQSLRSEHGSATSDYVYMGNFTAGCSN